VTPLLGRLVFGTSRSYVRSLYVSRCFDSFNLRGSLGHARKSVLFWQHFNMELETLRALPTKDQQTFLLGRIALETTSMDAALRFVNAALRGHRNVDAYLDAPVFSAPTPKSAGSSPKTIPS
jgi:hypothetical protein